MAHRQLTAGTTQLITLASGLSAFGFTWQVLSPSFDTVANDVTPNGWNMTQETVPNDTTITIPANAVPGDGYLLEFKHLAGPDYYGEFVEILAPPPPPPLTGWTRRQINLPFRRTRPAAKL